MKGWAFLILLAWSADLAIGSPALDALRSSDTLYREGKYYSSARYAFSALDEGGAHIPMALARATRGLMASGLMHAASYFFIRTLQTQDRSAIREVLLNTETLVFAVGPDLLRGFLTQYTEASDYNSRNRAVYLYVVAKKELLNGKPEAALRLIDSISERGSLGPYLSHLKGVSLALLGRNEAAVGAFRACEASADDILPDDSVVRLPEWTVRQRAESKDLRSRCIAGRARVLYQWQRFEEADRAYAEIPKESFVWTDILFEQAWNAFALGEYNRSLGKLVTYQSPSLRFVFNSEIEVLRAQSFVGLCAFEDANGVVNRFNSTYASIAKQVRDLVVTKRNDPYTFFELGKKALQLPIHTDVMLYRMMNRFVRGPYFKRWVESEREIASERVAVQKFTQMFPIPGSDPKRGFPAFLSLVLQWRERTAKLLGGTYVMNSLIDHHRVLMDDFDKIAFIKLELLRLAKAELLARDDKVGSGRFRGNVKPKRLSHQLFWSFDGEFWSDEIGDYVFGLESRCKKGG